MTMPLTVTDTPAVTRERKASWWRGVLPFMPILPALVFLLIFFVVPVGEILQGGLYNANGSVGIDQFRRIAATPVYAHVLWVTFAISLATAILSVFLGYPVAYLVSRLRARARERWLLWILLPFWTSYLVKTYAWMLLLSKLGVLSSIARVLGLLSQDGAIVPSLAGVLIGMVHTMLPLAIMTMVPIMQGIDEKLIHAAETLGARRGMSFFTIFLPLSAPGIAAAGLLVFISSLGFFIVPALLGSPKETMVAQLVISSVMEQFDMRFAGALSTMLLVCSLLAFFIYDRVFSLSSLTGDTSDRIRSEHGNSWRLSLLMLCGRLMDALPQRRRNGMSDAPGGPLRLYTLILLAALILPVVSLMPYAFTRDGYIAFPPHLFSLKWFATFLDSPIWQSAMIRSFSVALGTAILALLLGFGATLAMAHMPRRASKPLFALLLAPLIVPRVVIAVGMLYLFANLGLTGTNLGLIVGHTVLAIPFVVVTLAAGFTHFDWRLVDAARVMGASPLRRIVTVMIPLLMASISAAFLFAFLVSFDDLTIAIFVNGGVNTTLPKQMWDEIQMALTPTLAAVSTALIVLIAVMVALSSRIRRAART